MSVPLKLILQQCVDAGGLIHTLASYRSCGGSLLKNYNPSAVIYKMYFYLIFNK